MTHRLLGCPGMNARSAEHRSKRVPESMHIKRPSFRVFLRNARGYEVSVQDADQIARNAKQSRIARATVHRWISIGCRGRVLASILIGGRRLIHPSALEEFIQTEGSEQTESVSVLAKRERDRQERAEAAGRELDRLRGKTEDR